MLILITNMTLRVLSSIACLIALRFAGFLDFQFVFFYSIFVSFHDDWQFIVWFCLKRSNECFNFCMFSAFFPFIV